LSYLIDVLRSRTLGRKLIGERWRSLSAQVNPKPVFIFGNQKSGTTAIAGLLAAATGRTATLDFVGAREPYSSRLFRGETSLDTYIRRNAWAFSADIIKEPALTWVAPGLMKNFEGARAILIVRDPFDNIRSMLNKLNLPGDREFLDTGALRINTTWRAILEGTQLASGSRHYIDNLARRWTRAASILPQSQPRLTVVRYEDFNAAKTATIENLAHAAGFAITNDVSHLLDHAFQPRAKNKAQSTRDFFGPANFARIESICANVAEPLGYAVPGDTLRRSSPQIAAVRRAPVLNPIPAHN
jgi:hypothetical protein